MIPDEHTMLAHKDKSPSFLANDPSVFHVNDAIAEMRVLRFVGHHDYGLSVSIESAEKLDHLCA